MDTGLFPSVIAVGFPFLRGYIRATVYNMPTPWLPHPYTFFVTCARIEASPVHYYAMLAFLAFIVLVVNRRTSSLFRPSCDRIRVSCAFGAKPASEVASVLGNFYEAPWTLIVEIHAFIFKLLF